MDDEIPLVENGRRVDDEVLQRKIASKERVTRIERRMDSLKKDDPRYHASGYDDAQTKRLKEEIQKIRRSGVPSLTRVLPLIFSLKGEPYRLKDYVPFEPVFRTDMPQAFLLMTGRQVSKSTTLAARLLLMAMTIPYYCILTVTPLFEMIRRFSHGYVREFIETSPVRSMFVSQRTMNSVLQRTMPNGSSLYFSYAFLDAERTRGIPADENNIDEIQDMRHEFLQIIHETLSGSGWAIRRYAGTPKSLDNTIHHLWGDSSQAEFVIRCHRGGCNHWNIPSLEQDLLEMIGPWRSDISPEEPGVVCAKCQKPLDPPRFGRWHHFFPERRRTFAGHHVPQTIMPLHYADPKKWRILINKMQGKGNTSFTTFLNEVCGVSCDAGSKVVTETQLRAACRLPWKRKLSEALQHSKGYMMKVLAVDWGGGGGRLPGSRSKGTGDEAKARVSFTTLAVLGIKNTGKIDCLWGYRSLRTHDPLWEAQLCVEIMGRFRCSYLVHDYGGAGDEHEALITLLGFPASNIMGMRYHGAASHNMVVRHPPKPDHPREWFSVDKSRSLGHTCDAIKFGALSFFQWDRVNADEPGLLYDFLSLNTEKVTSLRTTDLYMIASTPNRPDDFAQAVNIGCSALWFKTGLWPDFVKMAGITADLAKFKYLQPKRIEWADFDG